MGVKERQPPRSIEELISELGESMCRHTPTEERWCRYATLLDAKGYTLRARYQPGWVPQWIREGRQVSRIHSYEDMVPPLYRQCLDATRRYDGAPSMLKFIDSDEAEIIATLSRIVDSHNYTIPVYDIIHLPDGIDSILITAQMADTKERAFRTVEEVLQFLQHLFEGVEFMHRHNIAHCDIAMGNMVLDPPRLDTAGLRLTRQSTTGEGEAVNVAPVRYYFIDFGHSVKYNSFEERKQVEVVKGQHKNIPEQAKERPIDPFKLDICQIGETILQDLLYKYDGLDFLIPLTRQLRDKHPSKRPDAAEALRQFEKLASGIEASAAAAKVTPREKMPNFVQRLLTY